MFYHYEVLESLENAIESAGKEKGVRIDTRTN